jgi:hypothetical protein
MRQTRTGELVLEMLDDRVLVVLDFERRVTLVKDHQGITSRSTGYVLAQLS